MRVPERQIVPLSKLNPAAYNPRKDLKRGDPEYDHLFNSIEAFGYLEPIVWNKATGNVVGGHQRLKVLQERGETEAEVVVVDFDEITEKAANLALNKIHGEWEFSKLADLLVNVDSANMAELAGFDQCEIEDLCSWTPPAIEDIDSILEESFAELPQHPAWVVVHCEESAATSLALELRQRTGLKVECSVGG